MTTGREGSGFGDRTWTRVGLALAWGFFAVGCSSDPTAAHEPPAGKEPVDPPAELTWTPCHDGLACASLAVPVDWANPGKTVALSLLRVPAGDPSQRLGTVVINPGGPGKPMVADLAKNLARYRLAFFQAFLRFDIVAFDWRGGGESAALRCATDAFLDHDFRAAPFELEAAEDVAAVEAVRASYVEGCGAQNDPTLLANVGVEAAARDLEAIRRALGEERLNYLGFSYGTRLGATYAATYPDRVRAFVLDSAVVPEPSLERRIEGRARSVEIALRRFVEACAAPGSPFHAGAPRAEVQAAIDALRVGIGAAAADAQGRALSQVDFDVALFAGLSSGDVASLATDLARAEAGDSSALLARADAVYGRGSDGVYDGTLTTSLAITCLDSPPSPTSTVASYASFASGLDASLTARRMASSPWAMCSGWPWRAAVANVARPAHGAPPLLVVQGRFDPNSGVEEATQLVASLDNGSHLLSYEGDGHVAALRSSCVRNAISAFFVDPSLAPSSSSCPAE